MKKLRYNAALTNRRQRLKSASRQIFQEGKSCARKFAEREWDNEARKRNVASIGIEILNNLKGVWIVSLSLKNTGG